MDKLIPSFFGAIIFYTTITLPTYLKVDLGRIARWLTAIGLLIGGLLGFVEVIFEYINLPTLTRSVLIISLWVYVTGGLHLDGAMDTADGLAVSNPQRRLEVMKDSVTGAFGLMAAVILLLIKTLALSEITAHRWLALMIAAAWGRWGQLMAIAFYPYLRATGKAAFLKQSFCFPQDCWFGSIFLLPLSLGQFFFLSQQWGLILLTQIACGAMVLLVGFWFKRQLGGHTGDTYGATVEWSEAFILCLLTVIFFKSDS
jgi:adenosylcobinamide-GDP ribazoletransferase